MKRPLGYIPGSWVLGVVLFYIAWDLGGYLYGQARPWARFDRESVLMIVTGLTALALGMARVVLRHPFFQPTYYTWLATSPWKRGLPMPAGSLTLNLGDAALLLLLCGLDARFGWEHAPRCALLFLIAHSLVHLLAFGWLVRPLAYLLVWIYATYCFLPLDPWIWLLPAVAAAAVCHFGTQYLLDRFPWEAPDGEPLLLPENLRKIRIDQVENPAALPGTIAGWPSTYLLDIPEGPRLSLPDGIMMGLTAGWWTLALGFAFARPSGRMVMYEFVWFLLVVGAVVRAYVYCKGTQPPINLWGRLFTFRWILPRYDSVYLPMIAACLWPWLFWEFYERFSIVSTWRAIRIDPLDASWPPAFVITVGFWILLLSPPSLRAWRLTGEHITLGPSQFSRNPQVGLKKI